MNMNRDKLNRLFQFVTFGCGAFLATAATFPPDPVTHKPVVAAWVLVLFGLFSAAASAMSKRVQNAASQLTVLDVVGWSAATVIQLLPGALGEAHIVLPRVAALLLAVAGTVVAMASHGPAAGGGGSAA
jgi:hypothetical protein